MRGIRTTVTLNSNTADYINERVREYQVSPKEAINQLIELGHFAAKKAKQGPRKKVKLKTFDFGLRPELRNANFNHLADELEDAAILDKLNLP